MDDSKIYVICHDDKSEEEARKSCEYDIIRISDTNPYFESQVFEHLEEKRGEWENKAYVGIITYSIFKKINDVRLDVLIQRGKDTGADIIPVLNIKFHKPRVSTNVSFVESVAFQHGPFAWHIIYNVLKNVGGFRDDQIFDKSFDGFISNWWIAKPLWMSKYISFVKASKQYIETTEILSEMVKENAYYLGANTVDAEKLRKTFGVPHYCLHPFIFERLPAFYFNLEKAKVIQSHYCIDWNLID
jgi:hypothetical protein